MFKGGNELVCAYVCVQDRWKDSLLGWHGFLKVPEFERVILGGGDQHGLHRVESQGAHSVKMTETKNYCY